MNLLTKQDKIKSNQQKRKDEESRVHVSTEKKETIVKL